MLVNEAWLKEFVDYSIPTELLTEKLTMAGLEVDSVNPAAADFSGVVVGQVTSVEAHPNADKLRLCKVSIGAEELIDIVCGASNVRVDLRIPVATIGAVLPGNFKIKKSKLRGEPSHGMLCSEAELGLAESADGLMELPADAPIGDNIRDYLQLDDTIIEVDLTPNRADCLSIEGVAREISCFSEQPWLPQTAPQIDVNIDDVVNVVVDAPQDCPRYLGRVIKGLDRTATTPIWMQEKLRRCGQRSLGPLVDVTNYVLLELGQPLHAFDLTKIDGDIVVRRGRQDEKLALLNEQSIDLDDDVLVIADQQQALAFAGVMGGESSAVNDDTQDIFLECAFFTPLTIAGKSRKYGLHTDASHRFERGVDPELCYRALDRTVQLLTDIAGGQVGPLTDVSSSDALPAINKVALRFERVERVLGIQLDEAVVEGYFHSLGMVVEKTAAEWLVTAPSYRFDIAIEADLIEEVARLYGYDNLPQNSLKISGSLALLEEKIQPLDRIKDLLVDRGYQEAITYSFTDEAALKLLTPNAEVFRLQNPISADLSVMRTTLWAGLLKAMDGNIKRNEDSVRFFETGLRFVVVDGELQQEQMLSLLVTGKAKPEQWAEPTAAVDFYDVKNDVEAIFALNGLASDYQFKASRHDALHPGQTAEITNKAGEQLGYMGLIHPGLESAFDIKKPVYLVELKLSLIQTREIPVFEAVSKYPSVRRDLALIVDEKQAVADISDYICQSGGIVKDVLVFDIYQGKGVENGRKSIALGLILQGESKTLVDLEIDEALTELLNNLDTKFNAQLRD
ncbi:MAG: phenylalanine--tRNA ligase subunit beta [Cycloclasticus sp.]